MAGLIAAGSMPSAGLLSIQRYDAAASSNLTLSTTETDVPGCSVTVTAQTDSAFYIAWGTFDAQQTSTASLTAIGSLSVDGTDETRQALFNGLTNGLRATVGQVWSDTLTAGSHTLKLRGQMLSSSGIRFSGTHTSLVVVVFG